MIEFLRAISLQPMTSADAPRLADISSSRQLTPPAAISPPCDLRVLLRVLRRLSQHAQLPRFQYAFLSISPPPPAERTPYCFSVTRRFPSAASFLERTWFRRCRVRIYHCAFFSQRCYLADEFCRADKYIFATTCRWFSAFFLSSLSRRQPLCFARGPPDHHAAGRQAGLQPPAQARPPAPIFRAFMIFFASRRLRIFFAPVSGAALRCALSFVFGSRCSR